MDVQVQQPNRPATLNKSNYGQSRTKSDKVTVCFHITNVKFWEISLKEEGLSLTLLTKTYPN